LPPIYVEYSTYLGGNSNQGSSGLAIAVENGDVYLVGSTLGDDFPTTSGAYNMVRPNRFKNIVVTKLNPTGSTLEYSTYIGGNSHSNGLGIAVDVTGNAYITGYTGASDFPTTPGAFSPVISGTGDAFVTKLNSTGSALIYSTYIGGNEGDQAFDIDIDSSGNSYITGYTASNDYPTTPDAVGSGVSGVGDAFVTKLNASGTALEYSTTLGGNSNDDGRSIAVDNSGNAYVTGDTSSSDFPTTSGAFSESYIGGPHQDAFVTKLNASGSALEYSTYFGGIDADHGYSIVLDSNENVYITGTTSSDDFPTTSGVYSQSFNGDHDAFIAKFY